MERCTKHKTKDQAWLSAVQHDRIVHKKQEHAKPVKRVCPNPHPGGCWGIFCQLCDR